MLYRHQLSAFHWSRRGEQVPLKLQAAIIQKMQTKHTALHFKKIRKGNMVSLPTIIDAHGLYRCLEFEKRPP